MARSDFKSAGAAAADGLPTSGSAEGLWLDVSTTSALGSYEARAGGGGGGAAAVAVRDAEHQLPRRRIALQSHRLHMQRMLLAQVRPGHEGLTAGCPAAWHGTVSQKKSG